MTPMEAWHIISANLCELYKMRRGKNAKKGYTDAEVEAEVICFQALKEMDGRSDNDEMQRLY